MSPLQTDEVPTYRDHFYVIDQHGQVLRLSERRIRERQQRTSRRHPHVYAETALLIESTRVAAIIERWVARYCRRHDLLQVNEVWVQVHRRLSDPLDDRPYLGWKVLTIARDRRVDQAYPVGAKAVVPPGAKLLAVMGRD